MKKLFAIATCAISIGMMAVPAHAESYYDGTYNVQSYNEMPDFDSNVRSYSGYTADERVSSGSRENPLDAEAAIMREQAKEAYMADNNGSRDSDIELEKRQLVINYSNYTQSEQLEKDAAIWDAARKQEIAQAQDYRHSKGISCSDDDGRRYHNDCKYQDLEERERQELQQISDRQEERARMEGWKATAASNGTQQKGIQSKYTNNKGQIEDIDSYAEEAWDSAFSASIVMTANFCMMDKSAARADPSGKCKKAICSVFGKKVCKAVF